MNINASSGASENTLWEDNAQWWIDGFTDGADAEYEEQILPLAAEELQGMSHVLDVGCGDGQVSRLVKKLGASFVAGVDPTWNQVTVASQRGGGLHVSEHIQDVDTAISEVARVLKPGGRFCFFLNHPLLQTPGSGWIDDQILDPPEQYWRIGAYLIEQESNEEVEKDIFIPFIHRPLSRYINALIANGLYVQRMLEPAPPPGFLARAAEYEDASTIPRLLYLRAVKLDV